MGLGLKSDAPSDGCPRVAALPSKCAGVLVLLLLFGIWGAQAQSEYETSSVYLWKT
ncbi:hypothetical protein JRQ81_018644, partial [Phrynocephalus forsythii]